MADPVKRWLLYRSWTVSLTFLLMLLLIVVNGVLHEWIRLAGALCTQLGIVANHVAVTVNGGRMPVRADRLQYDTDTHRVMTRRTRCWWLCDIIPVRRVTASIGDGFLFLGMGIALLDMLLKLCDTLC